MSVSRRIPALDIARTVALVGMAVYHFTYDLDLFGWIAAGTATSGGFAVFARVVAGSFLFLAGVSLYLAHGDGIRWRPFLRRAAMVGAAAAVISAGSYQFAPERYIFFGILHSILFASFVGLLALRLPWIMTLAVAVAIPLVREHLRSASFGEPWLLWIGLAPYPVSSMDYVPVFPWLGAFLAGIAAAKLGVAVGADHWLRKAVPPGRSSSVAGLPGRHSLLVYLIHQPILIGLIWLVTQALR